MTSPSRLRPSPGKVIPKILYPQAVDEAWGQRGVHCGRGCGSQRPVAARCTPRHARSSTVMGINLWISGGHSGGQRAVLSVSRLTVDNTAGRTPGRPHVVHCSTAPLSCAHLWLSPTSTTPTTMTGYLSKNSIKIIGAVDTDSWSGAEDTRSPTGRVRGTRQAESETFPAGGIA
jgi:hypothetical protein